jgi:Na+-transporting methylmalonyl-CoA/oxaloacetate decarboxylase gamma subunit
MQGLSISISGLIVTFTALGLFILVMVVLLAIFKDKLAVVEPDASGIVQIEKPVVRDDLGQEELIAAISAAVLFLRAKAQSDLGSDLDTGKSTWWVANRLNAQQGTGIRIKRSGK